MSREVKIAAKVAAISLAAFACASAASAATIVFTPGGGNLSAGEADYANFDTSFGNLTSVTGPSGTGVFAGSVSGVAAEPASGDQGDAFFAVLGGGSATFTFEQPTSSFGFDLGSSDNYNSITLMFSDGTSQSFSGESLNAGFSANGNQDISSTNGRVTFTSLDRLIGSATFASTANSFEFDNIGVAPSGLGAVPEPATWALFILGFGVVGAGLRRRSAASGVSRASFV